MKKRISATLFGVLTLALLGQFFQNCGSSKVPAASNSASSAPQVSVDPGNDIRKDALTGLVQIGGRCRAGNGDITVEGDVHAKSKVPCSGGTFLICTLLPKLGNNSVDVVQTAATQVSRASLTILEEQPNQAEIELEITSIQVTSATNANITIKCRPNSAIRATIYGVHQLGSEGAACPLSRTLTFPVTLIAGLANSGQRVVYVTQLTQEGRVDEVFADVDNVVQAHTCAITAGVGNQDLCIGSAGTISGTCKGGSPVKILVNDEAQHVAECKIDNTFRMDDVVMTRPGSNKISISQKTPFNTTCTQDKNVSAFSQIP